MGAHQCGEAAAASGRMRLGASARLTVAAIVHLRHELGVGVVDAHKPPATRVRAGWAAGGGGERKGRGCRHAHSTSQHGVAWRGSGGRQAATRGAVRAHVAGILQPFLLLWRSVMLRMTGWLTTVTASSLVSTMNWGTSPLARPPGATLEAQ